MSKFIKASLLLLMLMIGRSVSAMDVYFESRSLQEVLPWLASQMNESVIISPDIQDVLTLSIKNASWKDVMEAIAQQPHLRLEWQGSVAVLMPNRITDEVSADAQEALCQRAYWLLKHAKADIVGEHLQTLYPSLSLIVDKRTNSIVASTCDPLDGILTSIDYLLSLHLKNFSFP